MRALPFFSFLTFFLGHVKNRVLGKFSRQPQPEYECANKYIVNRRALGFGGKKGSCSTILLNFYISYIQSTTFSFILLHLGNCIQVIMDDAAYERQRQANIAANLALLQSLGLSSNKKTKKVVPRPKTKRLIPSDTSEESQERRRSERNRDKRKRTFHVNSESSVVSESGSEVQETRPIRTQPLWKMYKPKRGKVAVTSSSGSSNSEYKEESVENDTRRRSGRVRKTVLYSDDIYSDVKKHYGKRSRSVDHTYLLRDFIVEDKSSHDDDDDEEYSIRYVKKGKRRQSSPLLQRQAQRLGNRIHNPKRFGQIPGVPVGSWWATRMVRIWHTE